MSLRVRMPLASSPSVNRSSQPSWTLLHDTLLLQAAQTHQCSWIQVANSVPGKSHSQCAQRYSFLKENGCSRPRDLKIFHANISSENTELSLVDGVKPPTHLADGSSTVQPRKLSISKPRRLDANPAHVSIAKNQSATHFKPARSRAGNVRNKRSVGACLSSIPSSPFSQPGCSNLSDMDQPRQACQQLPGPKLSQANFTDSDGRLPQHLLRTPSHAQSLNFENHNSSQNHEQRTAAPSVRLSKSHPSSTTSRPKKSTMQPSNKAPLAQHRTLLPRPAIAPAPRYPCDFFSDTSSPSCVTNSQLSKSSCSLSEAHLFSGSKAMLSSSPLAKTFGQENGADTVLTSDVFSDADFDQFFHGLSPAKPTQVDVGSCGVSDGGLSLDALFSDLTDVFDQKEDVDAFFNFEQASSLITAPHLNSGNPVSGRNGVLWNEAASHQPVIIRNGAERKTTTVTSVLTPRGRDFQSPAMPSTCKNVAQSSFSKLQDVEELFEDLADADKQLLNDVPLVEPNWVENRESVFSQDQLAELTEQIHQCVQLCGNAFVLTSMMIGTTHGDTLFFKALLEDWWTMFTVKCTSLDGDLTPSELISSLPNLLTANFSARPDQLMQFFNDYNFRVSSAVQSKFLLANAKGKRAENVPTRVKVVQLPPSVTQAMDNAWQGQRDAFKFTIVPVKVARATLFSDVEMRLFYMGLVAFGFNDLPSIRAHFLPTKTTPQLWHRLKCSTQRASGDGIIKQLHLLPFKPVLLTIRQIIRLSVNLHGRDFKQWICDMFPMYPRSMLRQTWSCMYITGEVTVPWMAGEATGSGCASPRRVQGTLNQCATTASFPSTPHGNSMGEDILQTPVHDHARHTNLYSRLKDKVLQEKMANFQNPKTSTLCSRTPHLPVNSQSPKNVRYTKVISAPDGSNTFQVQRNLPSHHHTYGAHQSPAVRRYNAPPVSVAQAAPIDLGRDGAPSAACSNIFEFLASLPPNLQQPYLEQLAQASTFGLLNNLSSNNTLPFNNPTLLEISQMNRTTALREGFVGSEMNLPSVEIADAVHQSMRVPFSANGATTDAAALGEEEEVDLFNFFHDFDTVDNQNAIAAPEMIEETDGTAAAPPKIASKPALKLTYSLDSDSDNEPAKAVLPKIACFTPLHWYPDAVTSEPELFVSLKNENYHPDLTVSEESARLTPIESDELDFVFDELLTSTLASADSVTPSKTEFSPKKLSVPFLRPRKALASAPSTCQRKSLAAIENVPVPCTLSPVSLSLKKRKSMRAHASSVTLGKNTSLAKKKSKIGPGSPLSKGMAASIRGRPNSRSLA